MLSQRPVRSAPTESAPVELALEQRHEVKAKVEEFAEDIKQQMRARELAA